MAGGSQCLGFTRLSPFETAELVARLDRAWIWHYSRNIEPELRYELLSLAQQVLTERATAQLAAKQ
jgi:hypothetical protein